MNLDIWLGVGGSQKIICRLEKNKTYKKFKSRPILPWLWGRGEQKLNKGGLEMN